MRSRAAAIGPAFAVALANGDNGAEDLIQLSSILTSYLLPFGQSSALHFLHKTKLSDASGPPSRRRFKPSLLIPPAALIPLLRFNSSARVMGAMVLPLPLRWLLWGLCFAMIAANAALGALQLQQLGVVDASPGGVGAGIGVACGCIAYFGALLGLLLKPISWTPQPAYSVADPASDDAGNSGGGGLEVVGAESGTSRLSAR